MPGRLLQVLSVVGILLLSVGCGTGAPRVYAAKGKVTFEGKPLAWGGSIALFPLGAQPGKQAGGEIKDDGSYYLSTHTDGDGSMAGEFRVVVTQVTQKEPQQRAKDGEGRFTSPPTLPQAQHIPAIYGDSQKSPLTAKIEAKSLNEINFDLKRR